MTNTIKASSYESLCGKLGTMGIAALEAALDRGNDAAWFGLAQVALVVAAVRHPEWAKCIERMYVEHLGEDFTYPDSFPAHCRVEASDE